MKNLFKIFSLLSLVVILASCGGISPGGGELLTPPQTGSELCLREEDLDRATVVYTCESTGEEFIMAQADVTIEKTVIASYKKIAHFDKYCEDPRAYVAYCGDIQGGSCLTKDFIYYLVSPLPPPSPDTPPPDGSTFDIYMKKDAVIPDCIKCKDGTAAMGVAAEPPAGAEFIVFEGKSYIFVDAGAIDTADHLNPDREFEGTIDISDVTYEVFINLIFGLEPADEIIYLIEEGFLTDPPPDTVSYLEYRLVSGYGGKRPTLQLKSFKPAMGPGWWLHWIPESKPAIYLYPKEELKVDVKLNPAGRLTVSEPQYPSDGWQDVTAIPDGGLNYQGKFYPYLYYEAELEKVFVRSEGFIVEGKNLVRFFEGVLPKLGLNEWEIADFIKYWMGRLDRKQPYYFVHFLSSKQIEELEPLVLSIDPDTEIRIRPYFRPLERPINVRTQILEKPSERRGFTLVEWGGILDK